MALIGEKNENDILMQLKKYGIHNKEELDVAIKEMKLLNISSFICKIQES